MKTKYRIQTQLPVIQSWVYEVEAETEEAAREMVLNGEVEPTDYFTDDGFNHDYKITEVEII